MDTSMTMADMPALHATTTEEAVQVVVRVRPLNAEDHERGYSTCHTIDETNNAITLHPPPDLGSSASTSALQQGHTPTSLRREQSTPNSLQRRTLTRNVASPMSPSMRSAGPTTPTSRLLKRTEETRTFTFDRIFDEKATQTQVFDHVKPLVDAVVDGYNSTIFTYGQTGSGKTYTMFGCEEHPGLVPRAVKRLFELIDSRPDTVFVVKCSFVELHLDNFNDLLDVENHPSFKHKQLPNWRPKKIEIREDTRTGAVFLSGSDTLYTCVESVQHARGIIQAGMRLRSSAATKMNERSSRSHAILTFYVESRPAHPESAPVMVGKLHLVDLAGSERLVRSVVEGQNKKEAQQINASLTALGDVLEALTKSSKVPYRNNKLTRLLQDSLGGNSRTCFIINIQTTGPNYRETLTSLKYAHRAKMIKNKVSVNRDLFGASDIQSLTTEINHLRARLEERNMAYETIAEQQKSIGAENKELRRQLEQLSRINKEEKITMETQIGSIIHNKESLLVEQQHDFAVLQSKLDKRRKISHDLKVRLAMVEGEVLELKEKLKAAQMEAARLTTERDESRQLADKLQKKLKKHNTLSEERRKLLQQRVLELEAAVEKSESAYRRHIQKEREEGRGGATAIQNEYEEKLASVEKTLAASNKQVRLLLQQLEKAKEDAISNEEKLQNEIRSLREQLKAVEQKSGKNEQKLHTQIRLLQSQMESQRMSIETYEEREREREKEVRRASMKRARNRDLDDEDQPERRSAVSDYIEEKPVTKKNAKATHNAAREKSPSVKETSSLATHTSSAITSRPSVSSGLLSSTSGATYVAATKANNGLRSKGSTLKSLFPMTALPLSSDDDQQNTSLVAASPAAKKTKKDKPKKARKSKGKGKKRLSAEMADEEEENTQKENKENSAPTTSGSQIKKRKLLPTGKDDQVSLATPPSLASSAVSIGPVTKALLSKRSTSKTSLQRLLQAQKGQVPKLKSQAI